MSERNIEIKKQAKKEILLPELLAPVGGIEQLKAAVNNGADAVYLGGSLFNARMKADNFGGDKMKAAIDFAHERCVKVYITLNTLIKDRELSKAFDYSASLYEAGADALILQDLGLARLVRRYIPDFPIHLSTQGSVYNPEALELVKELGFSRVVPARELSLGEIREMCQKASKIGLEVEVFVHGALCMGYSGQCQMSRLLGAVQKQEYSKQALQSGINHHEHVSCTRGIRSGNRGLCAQPCRLEYQDDKGKRSYALSPKDICTIESVPALCEAGVDSFKIEGRLKSAEYVATVTRIYRKYLDEYVMNLRDNAESSSVSLEARDKRELLQIFNRGGFSSGYLYGNPGAKILSGQSPKNQGIKIGRIEAIKPVYAGKQMPRFPKGKAQGNIRDKEERVLLDVRLDKNETISIGDGVEIDNRTGNVITYCESLGKHIFRIGDFKQNHKNRISVGEAIYKVTDRNLNDFALASVEKKQGSDCLTMCFRAKIGEVPHLVVEDNRCLNVASVYGEKEIEEAVSRPAEIERIREQLVKLGGTPFITQGALVRIDINPQAMIPVSLVNSLRREAVRILLEKRKARERLALDDDVILRAKSDIQISKVNNKKWTLKLVPLELFMRDATMRENKEIHEQIVPYVFHISKGKLDKYIRENFCEIAQAVKSSGIALGNLGWIKQFSNAGIKVYGDYGLNAYNAQALRAYEELNIEMIYMSDEMSEDGRHYTYSKYAEGLLGYEAKSETNIRRVPQELERVALMVTEHPIESDYLIDRKGVKHTVYKWYSGDKHLLF